MSSSNQSRIFVLSQISAANVSYQLHSPQMACFGIEFVSNRTAFLFIQRTHWEDSINNRKNS